MSSGDNLPWPARQVVVVVDEVDGLLAKHQTILYRLFEWAKKANSRLILIGPGCTTHTCMHTHTIGRTSYTSAAREHV